MDNMIKKFEKIKKNGAYALNLTYGEGIGCDDSSMPTKDRSIIVTYSPVGHLGEGRVYWHGKYKDFLKFNFSNSPKIVNNPPGREEISEPGLYTWGTDGYVERIRRMI